jgi:VIT1/CCC1 family predicted Fe2+/Mn2+ transporter
MTSHKLQPDTVKKLERAQSGTARAALLGISDGLVTNVSLILGVAGSGASSGVVKIAGIASLLAGAFSMAVGEYISMKGQVELLESVLAVERQELRSHPDNARKALREVMIADGMDEGTATKASAEVASDPAKAMAMFARGKLGVNPDELGSAWKSALSSLFMFAIGAMIPLAPWLFGGGMGILLISVGVSVVAALAVGAYLGSVTTGRWVRTALRQLFVLILAAGATYMVGSLFHSKVM